MEYDFKDVAEKLFAGGMDEEHVNASITALKDAYASVPDEELLKKIEKAGGAEAIANGILNSFGIKPQTQRSADDTDAAEESDGIDADTTENAAEEQAEENGELAPDLSEEAADEPEAEVIPVPLSVPEEADGISQQAASEDGESGENGAPAPEAVEDKEKLDIISIDDDMFSDDADIDTAAPEEEAADIDQIVQTIEEGGAASTSAEEFFDDEDVKVKPSKPKQKPVKQQQSAPAKSKKTENTKKTSVKNMSKRAKTVYFIGLVFLIPLLIALVIVITVLFLSLFAAIIALVIASSVALVAVATVGTVLSLAAIIYGVIQIAQGVAAPIGMYEIGLGIVVGGGTLCLSILLYNFIVRLSPFLFKKMFVLYKFLVRQLSRLLGFVKGACSKL